ncbi:hypothetical protein ASG31_15810 [Chryseobacterium sp. Leaf404]|uniref:EpsG family protein n=1 Tax=unclassified Chryseobacterium TaxID=2593645 RepID=UPI0006F490B2|nr:MULTISPECIES: EpsG family protein [unclassified Chryseobacterium]KQT15066.1 hypothetical protein ASG31_15810 [Chryseobacterium sp. Leaf404]
MILSLNLMEEFKLKFYVIYLIFAVVAIIFSMYVDIKKKHYNSISAALALALFSATAFLFGLRDLDVGADTDIVRVQFEFHDRIDFGFQFMFDFLIALVSQFTDNYHIFLLVLSLLFNGLIFSSVLIFSRRIDLNIFLVSFSFVSFYFFEQLGINIVRQGVSLAFFLLAVSLYFKNPSHYKLWIISMVFAVGFHITTVMVLLIFGLVILLKKLKTVYFYALYFLVLIISAVGGSILSFGSLLSYFFLVDSQRADFYINNENGLGYEVGFKTQFAIFNTLFLGIFTFINSRILKYEDESYEILLKYYMVMSAVFFLMFQIPFSDRWGMMSWITIPFLLAPLFSINRTARYSMGTLGFLFVIFVTFSMYYSSK